MYGVAVIGLVIVRFVKDQPEFKTRVGATNTDAPFFAVRYRLFIIRVFVAVKHRPDLVKFLKRVPFPAASAGKPLGPRVLDRFGRHRVGDTYSRNGFHSDQST